MNSPIKTRALERAAHERRLLATIEAGYADLNPRERELWLEAAIKQQRAPVTVPSVWGDEFFEEGVTTTTATVTPTAKADYLAKRAAEHRAATHPPKPKSWRHKQAEKTSVSAEKRYGRKR